MTTPRPAPVKALWIAEFGESFAVPASIANHPNLIDVSWHNDTHPSFQAEGNPRDVRLWVDHVDPSQREIRESVRFCVFDHVSEIVLFESETDADAAIFALLQSAR